MAVDKELAGMLSLSDTVRPEAAATVAALQREGFKTFLLTGRLKTCSRRLHAHVAAFMVLATPVPGNFFSLKWVVSHYISNF